MRTMLLLIWKPLFSSILPTTTLEWFFVHRTHRNSNLAIPCFFQHWKMHSVGAHFQVVLLMYKRFSSKKKILKKSSRRQWNRGVSIKKCAHLQRNYVSSKPGRRYPDARRALKSLDKEPTFRGRVTPLCGPRRRPRKWPDDQSPLMGRADLLRLFPNF